MHLARNDLHRLAVDDEVTASHSNSAALFCLRLSGNIRRTREHGEYKDEQNEKAITGHSQFVHGVNVWGNASILLDSSRPIARSVSLQL